jgi:N utilization substance protein A
VARVYVDADEQALEIIVPDDQLSLAIGKKGQNVRLAAKLIGWKIDIKSETRAAEIDQEESLLTAQEDDIAVESESDAAAGLAARHTRDELYEMAKEFDVPGRSAMTKEELARHLAPLVATDQADAADSAVSEES